MLSSLCRPRNSRCTSLKKDTDVSLEAGSSLPVHGGAGAGAPNWGRGFIYSCRRTPPSSGLRLQRQPSLPVFHKSRGERREGRREREGCVWVSAVDLCRGDTISNPLLLPPIPVSLLPTPTHRSLPPPSRRAAVQPPVHL